MSPSRRSSTSTTEVEPVASAAGFDEIPIVDLGDLDGSAAQRAALAERVCTVCHEVGFMIVTDHGVDDSVVDDVFDLMRRFFALDEEHAGADRQADVAALPGVGVGGFGVHEQPGRRARADRHLVGVARGRRPERAGPRAAPRPQPVDARRRPARPARDHRAVDDRARRASPTGSSPCWRPGSASPTTSSPTCSATGRCRSRR